LIIVGSYTERLCSPDDTSSSFSYKSPVDLPITQSLGSDTLIQKASQSK
jgi:hypothetical protein